jgi:predicted nucleic acid-binding protein
VIVVDTGVLYAAIDRDDADHAASSRVEQYADHG